MTDQRSEGTIGLDGAWLRLEASLHALGGNLREVDPLLHVEVHRFESDRFPLRVYANFTPDPIREHVVISVDCLYEGQLDDVVSLSVDIARADGVVLASHEWRNKLHENSSVEDIIDGHLDEVEAAILNSYDLVLEEMGL